MEKIINLTESDLNLIITKVLQESESKFYKRRIEELRDSIMYQTEIQDPCNFEDGDDYATFCISQGMGFFFGFDLFGNTDFGDDDGSNKPEISLKEYNEINDQMYTDYYDELVSIWNENDESDC
jgi:hypothetical protein